MRARKKRRKVITTTARSRNSAVTGRRLAWPSGYSYHDESLSACDDEWHANGVDMKSPGRPDTAHERDRAMDEPASPSGMPSPSGPDGVTLAQGAGSGGADFF
jgi:hypothetical protein